MNERTFTREEIEQVIQQAWSDGYMKGMENMIHDTRHDLKNRPHSAVAWMPYAFFGIMGLILGVLYAL